MVVESAEKTFQLRYVAGCGPVTDYSDVFVGELLAVFVYDTSEILELCLEEMTLLGVEGGTMRSHAGKDVVKVFESGVEVCAKDDNVVKVN